MRSTIGWPPSSAIPASNDTRVRVDGFWKISATVRRASASELNGAALSSSARSISSLISAELSSAPVRKWRGKPSSVRWGSGSDVVARADLEPLARASGARRGARPVRGVRVRSRRLGVGSRAAPGGAAVVARAAGRATGRRSAGGAHVPQRAAGSAPCARGPLAGPVKSNGGGANAILVRGERIVEHRARGCAGCRSAAGCTRSGCGAESGWRNLHTASDAAQGRRAAAALLEWAGGRAGDTRRRLQRAGPIARRVRPRRRAAGPTTCSPEGGWRPAVGRRCSSAAACQITPRYS